MCVLDARGHGANGREESTMRLIVRGHRVRTGLAVSLFLVVAQGCGRQEQVRLASKTSQGSTSAKISEKTPQPPPSTTKDGGSTLSRAPTPGPKPIVVVRPRLDKLARSRPREPEVGTNLLGLPGVTIEHATVTG